MWNSTAHAVHRCLLFCTHPPAREPLRHLLQGIPVYAVYTWISRELWVSAGYFVFAKSLSRILKKHIGRYKAIELNEPLCTQPEFQSIEFHMFCIYHNTPAFSKMQKSRLLYTISILSPHMYTPFAFVYNIGISLPYGTTSSDDILRRWKI